MHAVSRFFFFFHSLETVSFALSYPLYDRNPIRCHTPACLCKQLKDREDEVKERRKIACTACTSPQASRAPRDPPPRYRRDAATTSLPHAHAHTHREREHYLPSDNRSRGLRACSSCPSLSLLFPASLSPSVLFNHGSNDGIMPWRHRGRVCAVCSASRMADGPRARGCRKRASSAVRP